MIRDLTDLAVNMVRAEKAEEVQEKAAVLAEEKILDILIPPVKRPSNVSTTADVNPENDEALQNEKTREWMREKLRKGDLDERMIEYNITSPGVGMQVLGPVGFDDMGMNIQELMSSMVPKKQKKKKSSIKDARKVMVQEEAQKLIDMEAVQREAIKRVQESGIVFIDEIDKIAGTTKGGGSEAPTYHAKAFSVICCL